MMLSIPTPALVSRGSLEVQQTESYGPIVLKMKTKSSQ